MLKQRREKTALKLLRLARRFLFVLIMVLAVASPFLISTVQANSEPMATLSSAFVWTDKKEYDPSETANIFGYDFNAYANVTVTIQRPDLSQDMILTSTDEFGYFTCQYVLDGIEGTYIVTATDEINTATTTFSNCLYLKVRLGHCTNGTFIKAKVRVYFSSKSYYVKYFDPDGVERRTSPTYTGLYRFTDYFIILPTLPKILGTWTVKLYKDTTVVRTKTVSVKKIVWTTDSAFTTMVTSFAQSETVYFKAIGLLTTKYYRFMLELPDGTKIYVGEWTTGVTTLTGSYDLPTTAQIGTWKLHVREAVDATGECEHHYVDCCFIVTTPPPPLQYYLTIQTDPADITTILGQGWYNACTSVNLTAPDTVPGPAGIRYRFDYWDVDGPAVAGNPITVHMDTNHTATAHYITQYYLNLTTDPPGVTVPSGIGWYDAGTNASIFTPEFIGITPGASRYRFVNWTTEDMAEIADSSVTSTTVLMDKAKTVTANYVIQYHLTVKIDPADITTILGEGWYDNCTYVNLTAPEFVPNATGVSGERYRFDNWTVNSDVYMTLSITVHMDANFTATAHYVKQYYLTVTSPYGTPSGEGWYDECTDAYAGLDTGVVSGPAGTQFVFLRWTGDASGTDYSQSDAIHMDAPKTAIAEWKTQYYLTVISPFDTPGGEGWYDNCTDAYATLATRIVDHGNGTRRVFTHWSGDASGTDYSSSDPIHMDAPKTAVANWKTQYLLKVLTDPTGLSPGPTRSLAGEAGPGGWWYDNCTDVILTAQPVTGYTFLNWDVDGFGDPNNPITVHVHAPHIATAHYETAPPPPPPAVGGEMALIKIAKPVVGPSSVELIVALLTALIAAVVLVKWRRKT